MRLLHARTHQHHAPMAPAPHPHARILMCDALRFAQAAEHAAAAARAVADDNARATVVFISGATGPWAAAINGFFAPTLEKGLDGRFVLSKRGDASMCIEQFGGQWQVKPVSSKGTDGCCAYVAGDCALQDCASGVWKVYDGQTLVDQASVKLAIGSEAEQKVCGGCTRALRHSPPLCTSQSCLVTPIFTAHLTRIILRRLKAKPRLPHRLLL